MIDDGNTSLITVGCFLQGSHSFEVFRFPCSIWEDLESPVNCSSSTVISPSNHHMLIRWERACCLFPLLTVFWGLKVLQWQQQAVIWLQCLNEIISVKAWSTSTMKSYCGTELRSLIEKANMIFWVYISKSREKVLHSIFLVAVIQHELITTI